MFGDFLGNIVMDLATKRIENVLNSIERAAQSVGRDVKNVKLIGISKTKEVDEIQPVIDGGLQDFGENRVQEAQSKWPGLLEKNDGLTLHLVGPLQSNKAKDAVELFDCIHSIDRSKIAKTIADEIAKQGKKPKLLVQVNTGEEPQKAGVLPLDVTDFVKECQNDYGLEISGLMCIPPVDEEPALHFGLLVKKAEELGLPELSMGMSKDFETAVEFGATYIRVGTALFGERG